MNEQESENKSTPIPVTLLINFLESALSHLKLVEKAQDDVELLS